MVKNIQGIEAIKSKAWKSQFLSLLSKFDGVLALANELNHGISSRSCLVLEPLVRSIISQYQIEELAVARQYYNNSHLIEFWRWYNQEEEKLIHSGKINGDFPVFSIANGYFPKSLIIESHDIDYFRSFTYKKDPERPYVYSFSNNKGASNQHEQKIGQLHLLNNIIKQSTIFYYHIFISEHIRRGSSVFDDYRIHKFLDRFLYQSPDGQMCSSPFEEIFFSNNLHELEVYLNYVNDNNYEPDFTQIKEFLERQRRYYLMLATDISKEENAFLNNNRHLLFYEPDKGVVVMPKMTSYQYSYYHNELKIKTGIVEINGCPFAKSKGVSKNAVIEVFSRFDRLMLKLIERW